MDSRPWAFSIPLDQSRHLCYMIDGLRRTDAVYQIANVPGTVLS
jgi:hypothetical protein